MIVAAFFNLLFLLLTLRMLCTRIAEGRDTDPAAADAERPDLRRVTPTVVIHPDHEVTMLLI